LSGEIWEEQKAVKINFQSVLACQEQGFTEFGEPCRTLCLTDWCRVFKVNPPTVHSRLERGWPIEKALTVGDTRENQYTYSGITASLGNWCIATGIKYNTFIKRISYGWSIEKALNTPVKKDQKNHKKTKS